MSDATATYHFEDGVWWASVAAEGQKWTGQSDTLAHMQALAREGIFMVTGKYPQLRSGFIATGLPLAGGEEQFALLESFARESS